MTWRSTLETAADAVTSALAAAGLDAHAVLDPRHLASPGVWLKLNALDGNLDGGLASITVYVLTPDAADWPTILDNLEPLAAVVLGIVPPMSRPTFVAVPMPAGGTPSPALRYDHELILDA